MHKMQYYMHDLQHELMQIIIVHIIIVHVHSLCCTYYTNLVWCIGCVTSAL